MSNTVKLIFSKRLAATMVKQKVGAKHKFYGKHVDVFENNLVS